MLNIRGVFFAEIVKPAEGPASRTNDYVGETLVRGDGIEHPEVFRFGCDFEEKKHRNVCTHDHPKSSKVKSRLNLTVVSFGQSKCISSKNCGPK